MPAKPVPEPKIAILLGTYNGAKYLAEQLDSFERQSHTHWQVWASDDGSTDTTLEILRHYRDKWGAERMVILEGPRAGSTANFMSLAYNPAISADYYAFSDQDDIWEHDKLERALHWLNSLPPAKLALYCSRTRLVDEHNNEIGFSQLFQRAPGLANALMQNIAGGNTMVFNKAMRSILGETAPKVVIHDWWVYLATAACGGEIKYDPYPSLRYRQHAGNLIGMNIGVFARVRRIGKLFKNHYRAWTDCNLSALETINNVITPANQKLINDFKHARKLPLFARMAAFKKLGLYRQTRLGNLGLTIGVLFNKL